MAPPEKNGPPYQGPPIHIDDAGDTLAVVIQSPSPGWQVHLDRVEEGFQTRDILVTIIEPNPCFAYAQRTVEQRVATIVTKDLAARVFARRVPFTPLEQANGAYSMVASRQAGTESPKK